MQQINLTAKDVLTVIVDTLEQQLHVAIQAAKDAHFAATHSESVAETKYDTFGLESSYLAQGQQKRVDEINQALIYFKPFALSSINEQPLDLVELNSLVTIENDDEVRHFFVAAHSGGLKLDIAQHQIMLVTPQSPVGASLLGQSLDDEVQILVKGKKVSFDIVAIA